MSVLWIPFTIMAAFMQSWRNALQKQLRQYASTLGVTFARFCFALPLSVVYLILLHQYFLQDTVTDNIVNTNSYYSYHLLNAFPNFSPKFFIYILIAAFAQIAATAFMVMLFQARNYAVGVGLAKSEAVIAATLGALFFAAPLSLMAWLGVLVGAVAVWLMSLTNTTNNTANNSVTKITDNISDNGTQKLSLKTIGTGLASGLCFALCTLFIRQAALNLQQTSLFASQQQAFLLSAAWVLFFVLLVQTLSLFVWLVIKEPKTLQNLYQHKGLTLAVSLFSFFGSIGWFTAMSLQTVAMVKTLGQIEVLFTLAISAFWFKETLGRNDYLGLALIMLGALLVVLA